MCVFGKEKVKIKMNRSKSKKNKNGKSMTTPSQTQPPSPPNNNNNTTLKSNTISNSKLKANSNKSIINTTKNGDKKSKMSTMNDPIMKKNNEDPKGMASPPTPPPKKLERSNSFLALIRKGIFRNSQDELNKSDKPKNPVPVMVRSRTQLDMPTRSFYRRSIREPKLEELIEEHDGDTLKPVSEIPIVEVELNGMGDSAEPNEGEVILRGDHTDQSKFERRSRNSASFRSYVHPDQLEDGKESSGLLSKLKRTFSTKSDRRSSLNSKWSVSLQSLQQIDTMVSYEDLRFIDYDKFNTYEKQIDRRLSRIHVSNNNIGVVTTTPNEAINPQIERLESSLTSSCLSIANSALTVEPEPVVPKIDVTVVKRRTKSVHFRPKIQFDSTFEKNFDEGKNVYRQSFDGKTLEHFHNVNRDSFRLSMTPGVTETLLLDNYLEEKTDKEESAEAEQGFDVTDDASVKPEENDEVSFIVDTFRSFNLYWDIFFWFRLHETFTLTVIRKSQISKNYKANTHFT